MTTGATPRIGRVTPKLAYPLRWHVAAVMAVVTCILLAYAPGLLPERSAMVSHHAGDLDTIYRQAQADGTDFGKPLDDPAPSWQWEPLDAVASEAFRNHEWPLWQPYGGFGSPLLTTLDSSVFAPTKLLLYLGLTTNRTWVFVAQLILAGAFTYALGVGWGWHPVAAATAAVGYALSGYLANTTHYPQATSAALLPVALWAAHLAATRRPGGVPTFGVVLGTLVLTGHPEASLAMILAAGAFGLVTAYSQENWHAFRTRDPWPATRLTLAAAIGVATAAIVLLPLAGVMADSVSHVHAKPVHDLFDPRLFTAALTFAVSAFVPTPAITAWLGQTLWHAGYAGPAVLALALVAPRTKFGHWPATLALAMVAVAFLALTPQHGVLRGVVYFESYYAIGIGSWVVAALTGIGIDAVLTGNPPTPSRHLASAQTVLLAMIVAAFVVANGAFTERVSGSGTSRDVLSWSALVIAVATATAIVRGRRPVRHIAAVATAALSAGWLLLWTATSIDAVDQPDTNAPPPVIAAANRANPLARTTGLDYTTLQGNAAANWRLHDPKLSAAFHTCRFLEFMARASDPPGPTACEALTDSINVTLTGASPRGLHLAGIGSVLYPPTRTANFPESPVPATLAYHDRFVAAATLDRTLPRAYIVHRARACDRLVPDAVGATFADDFDPFREVLLEPGLPPGNRDLSADPDGDWRARCPVTTPGTPPDANAEASEIETVELAAYHQTSVTFDIDLDAPAWLVLLDRNAPGWTATANGSPVPILTANALFRAVRLDTETRRVEFRYWPDGFGPGLAITLVTLAGTGTALTMAMVRTWRARMTADILAITTGLALVATQAWVILGFMPR